MCILQNVLPSSRSAKTDNVVFQLFYRYSVLILLVFGFVITCRLWLGDSFRCVSNVDLPSSFIDMYCYAHNPFIVVSAISKKVGYEVPYPGIAPAQTRQGKLEKLAYVSYYPWVNLFFLVLATLFYLPHLFWRICEGGLMTRLTAKVNDSSVSEAERKAAIMEIGKYILTTRGGHLLYTGAYVLAEAMNWLVVVLLNIWLSHFFKSDEFKTKSWEDFLAYNFPTVAKCSFYMYGPSTDIRKHDTLCLLPLNKLFGYMFLFLYVWFIMHCALAALVVPYRLLGLLLPPIRLLMFRLRSGVADQSALDFANANLSFGDWFVLTRLQKNLAAHDLTKLLICIQQNFSRNPTELEMEDLMKLT